MRLLTSLASLKKEELRLLEQGWAFFTIKVVCDFADAKLLCVQCIDESISAVRQDKHNEHIGRAVFTALPFMIQKTADFLFAQRYTLSQSHRTTLCSEKTPTHIFFHISMNDEWI